MENDCLEVGLLGFEPRKTGPESVVLPLHHNPMNCFLYFGNYVSFVGLLGFEPRKTGPESVVLPLHHSPILMLFVIRFSFDAAKVQLFCYIQIVLPFFFKKIVIFSLFPLLIENKYEIRSKKYKI